MHIYISILLLLIIAIIVGWFVIGIVFNNLVLSRISDYWRNKHRLGSQVPSWTEPLAFAIAGPIGWGLWLFGWLEDRYRRISRSRRS